MGQYLKRKKRVIWQFNRKQKEKMERKNRRDKYNILWGPPSVLGSCSQNYTLSSPWDVRNHLSLSFSFSFSFSFFALHCVHIIKTFLSCIYTPHMQQLSNIPQFPISVSLSLFLSLFYTHGRARLPNKTKQ